MPPPAAGRLDVDQRDRGSTMTPEDEIRAFLGRLAAPPREPVDAFLARGRRGLLARGEPLVRLGETAHPFAFLHTGIVRFHVIHPDTGEDVTKDFAFAPGTALSFGSAVRGQPARVAVTAVLDCALTLWPAADWFALLEQHIELQKIGRKIAERLYVRKEDRELAFLMHNADQRYDALTTLFPPEAAQIPQHFLASYLGITPESLSRLKKRRKPG
jgi:CRP-like cAMP-binding protein